MTLKYRLVNIDIISNVDGKIISSLKLDSRKYDNIGFTKESLDDYMDSYNLGERNWRYLVIHDKVF
jgi:hypothetical protein